MLLTYYFLFKVVFRDSGLIPKNSFNYNTWKTTAISQFNNLHIEAAGPRQKSHKQNIWGYFLEIKYCQTCNIYWPPWASHCHICNFCVEKFDHHCPYIGVCIGKKNYVSFIMYLVCLSIQIIYIFVCSLVYAIMNLVDTDNNGSLGWSIVYFFIVLACIGVR